MSEPLGRPPVEDLSDVAWARVERNVFSRLDEGTITHAAAAREVASERRNKWVWFAIPSVAAAAAFALVFFSLSAPSTTTTIDEPSRIVSSSAPSSVTFGDVHVTLDANSAVVMDQKAGKPTALLENGGAVFTVAPPRAARSPFTVLAGDATIRATDGQFRVAREGERATVTVEAGSVEIRFRGHEIHVDAHQTWSSEDQAR